MQVSQIVSYSFLDLSADEINEVYAAQFTKEQLEVLNILIESAHRVGRESGYSDGVENANYAHAMS